MDLSKVWNSLQSFDGTKPVSFDFPLARVKFYMGAMEIPMISLSPKVRLQLTPSEMESFSQILNSNGLELDCVAEGGNYKINRSEDGQYMGRVTEEALKLHAVRIREVGEDLFQKIVHHLIKKHE